MILFRCPGHGLIEQSLFVDRRRPVSPRPACERDVGPIGQHGQGLGKLDPFHLHHEAEDVAADVADPALERLPLGIDLQAGAGVVVPGAEGLEVAALAAQRHVAADQIDDVDRLLDPLLQFERCGRRQLRKPSGGCHVEMRLPDGASVERAKLALYRFGFSPEQAAVCGPLLPNNRGRRRLRISKGATGKSSGDPLAWTIELATSRSENRRGLSPAPRRLLDRPVVPRRLVFCPASGVACRGLNSCAALPKSKFFPPAELAEPEGVVLFGGRLTNEWLLDAYAHGIFPWPIFDGTDIVVWWSPDPRAIFEFDALSTSRGGCCGPAAAAVRGHPRPRLCRRHCRLRHGGRSPAQHLADAANDRGLRSAARAGPRP